MILRKIAHLGHPVLLRRARPVEDPLAAEVRALIADMRATLDDAHGLGLAAPQVFESLRVILVRPVTERESSGAEPPYVLINPEIEPDGEAVETAFEGCLSIPELRGAVPRLRSVVYRGLDEEGRPVEGRAEGLHARILQHEVDHLDGFLFLMRMDDLRLLAFASELPHLQRALEARTEERP